MSQRIPGHPKSIPEHFRASHRIPEVFQSASQIPGHPKTISEASQGLKDSSGYPEHLIPPHKHPRASQKYPRASQKHPKSIPGYIRPTQIILEHLTGYQKHPVMPLTIPGHPKSIPECFKASQRIPKATPSISHHPHKHPGASQKHPMLYQTIP